MTCAEFSTEKFRTQDIFTHAIQTIERTQILKYPECSPHSLHQEKKKKGIQNILYPKKAASVILLKCSADHVIALFKTPRPCPFTLGCDGIGRKETLNYKSICIFIFYILRDQAHLSVINQD